GQTELRQVSRDAVRQWPAKPESCRTRWPIFSRPEPGDFLRVAEQVAASVSPSDCPEQIRAAEKPESFARAARGVPALPELPQVRRDELPVSRQLLVCSLAVQQDLDPVGASQSGYTKMGVGIRIGNRLLLMPQPQFQILSQAVAGRGGEMWLAAGGFHDRPDVVAFIQLWFIEHCAKGILPRRTPEAALP